MLIAVKASSKRQVKGIVIAAKVSEKLVLGAYLKPLTINLALNLAICPKAFSLYFSTHLLLIVRLFKLKALINRSAPNYNSCLSLALAATSQFSWLGVFSAKVSLLSSFKAAIVV